MALHVRLANGGEDVFQGKNWSDEYETEYGPTYHIAHHTRHEFFVRDDGGLVVREVWEHSNFGTWIKHRTQDVAYYPRGSWITVRET